MHRPTALLASVLLLLASCGEAHFDTPQDALQTFLDRSIDGDESGATACLVADERNGLAPSFQIDRDAAGYSLGELELDGKQAVLAVRFPGEEQDMRFVLVQQDGWNVSLGYTMARGLTENVGLQMDALGANPTPEQMIEAMGRGMQNQPTQP